MTKQQAKANALDFLSEFVNEMRRARTEREHNVAWGKFLGARMVYELQGIITKRDHQALTNDAINMVSPAR